jgi:uncharacterized protein with LGFP repeats
VLERVGPSPDNHGAHYGFRRDHVAGAAFWSSLTGLGTVGAELLDCFESVGGLARLGFPLGVERQAGASPAGTAGSFQRFEGPWFYSEATDDVPFGATLYSSRHGVYWTWGGFGEFYELAGGTVSSLGFPTSGEERAVLGPRGTEGIVQTFEGGTLYWTDDIRIAALGAAAAEVHEDLRDVLGFPVSGEEDAGQSPLGTTGTRQRFEGAEDYPAEVTADWRHPGGAVVYSSDRGTWVTTGGIGLFYEKDGGPAGPLGYPTNEQGQDVDDTYQFFENGYVSWLPDRGAIPVLGVTADMAVDFELGPPTSWARQLDDGPDQVQFFEKGLVTVVDGEAACWRRPDPPAPE